MPLLSKDTIKTLTERPEGLCISIFLPTHQAGPEIQQDPIRFKNLMRQAEAQLVEHGMRQTEAVELLSPAQELDNPDFWRHQDQGLAIFIATNFFRYYRLPLDFEELVVVSDRFHLKPLMQLLTGDGHFYVLTLSQQELRLLEGSRYGMSEIELNEDIPESVAEALQYDWAGKGVQYRISTSRGGTNNPFPQTGSVHGQGSPETDDIKRNLEQFFHQVDHGISEQLHGEQAPLVLAGVEYLFPIYKEANTYPHLMEEGIPGNQKLLKPEELHEPAWKIVEPHFLAAQKQAIERYQELTGTGQKSTDLQEIVPAAYYQRVDVLFVPVGQQCWGYFDLEKNTVVVHDEQQPGDEDVLDFAAIHTLLNGGTVYAVDPDNMPDHASIAAILRY